MAFTAACSFRVCMPRRFSRRMYEKSLKRVSRGCRRGVGHCLTEKGDRREPGPEGALKPFNIDAKLNGGYIALGLLYGKGDFWNTLEIATRAGQDSDCNPSNACGILGVMLGYKKIPEQWRNGIPKLADT